MGSYKVVVITQVFNEVKNGNLERFFRYAERLGATLVVYDDGSTDGSYEYSQSRTPHVIRSNSNFFDREVFHKKTLLAKALTLNPDFVLWLDADEVLGGGSSGAEALQRACQYCIDNQLDGLSIQMHNLWRSTTWKREDTEFGEGWFVRLWRNSDRLRFGPVARGLHQASLPKGLDRVERSSLISLLHFGFSAEEQIYQKYFTYAKNGQRGYHLDRLIDESELVTSQLNAEIYPTGLWQEDPPPVKRSLPETFEHLADRELELSRPRISIVALIYRSTEWAEFVYQQVLKYTPMKGVEFFFVANDASEEVIRYLKSNYIPHYEFNNRPEYKNDWYINNVYRAWNYGAQKARGEIVVFVNSDMAFTPDWLEALEKNLSPDACVASRLVEMGRLRSGTYGIERDFGRSPGAYAEEAFQQYAAVIRKPELHPGGLFMPLAIRKDHFEGVGGFPEGNVVAGSDYKNPVIAKPSDPLISGDVVLMSKLSEIGVEHKTAFDSVVYHFQCGEQEEILKNDNAQKKTSWLLICDDEASWNISTWCRDFATNLVIDEVVDCSKPDFSRRNLRKKLQESDLAVLFYGISCRHLLADLPEKTLIVGLADKNLYAGRVLARDAKLCFPRVDGLIVDSVEIAANESYLTPVILNDARDRSQVEKLISSFSLERRAKILFRKDSPTAPFYLKALLELEKAAAWTSKKYAKAKIISVNLLRHFVGLPIFRFTGSRALLLVLEFMLAAVIFGVLAKYSFNMPFNDDWLFAHWAAGADGLGVNDLFQPIGNQYSAVKALAFFSGYLDHWNLFHLSLLSLLTFFGAASLWSLSYVSDLSAKFSGRAKRILPVLTAFFLVAFLLSPRQIQNFTQFVCLPWGWVFASWLAFAFLWPRFLNGGRGTLAIAALTVISPFFIGTGICLPLFLIGAFIYSLFSRADFQRLKRKLLLLAGLSTAAILMAVLDPFAGGELLTLNEIAGGTQPAFFQSLAQNPVDFLRTIPIALGAPFSLWNSLHAGAAAKIGFLWLCWLIILLLGVRASKKYKSLASWLVVNPLISLGLIFVALLMVGRWKFLGSSGALEIRYTSLLLLLEAGIWMASVSAVSERVRKGLVLILIGMVVGSWGPGWKIAESWLVERQERYQNTKSCLSKLDLDQVIRIDSECLRDIYPKDMTTPERFEFSINEARRKRLSIFNEI